MKNSNDKKYDNISLVCTIFTTIAAIGSLIAAFFSYSASNSANEIAKAQLELNRNESLPLFERKINDSREILIYNNGSSNYTNLDVKNCVILIFYLWDESPTSSPNIKNATMLGRFHETIRYYEDSVSYNPNGNPLLLYSPLKGIEDTLDSLSLGSSIDNIHNIISYRLDFYTSICYNDLNGDYHEILIDQYGHRLEIDDQSFINFKKFVSEHYYEYPSLFTEVLFSNNLDYLPNIGYIKRFLRNHHAEIPSR